MVMVVARMVMMYGDSEDGDDDGKGDGVGDDIRYCIQLMQLYHF